MVDRKSKYCRGLIVGASPATTGVDETSAAEDHFRASLCFSYCHYIRRNYQLCPHHAIGHCRKCPLLALRWPTTGTALLVLRHSVIKRSGKPRQKRAWQSVHITAESPHRLFHAHRAHYHASGYFLFIKIDDSADAALHRSPYSAFLDLMDE